MNNGILRIGSLKDVGAFRDYLHDRFARVAQFIGADTVAVIDTASRKIAQSIPTLAPPGLLHLAKSYRGVSPDGLHGRRAA